MADAIPAEDFTMNYEEIKWDYSKSKDAEDSFDFTATPVQQKVGLLLPAVQVVEGGQGSEDSLGLTATIEEQKVGLLLPAVQQVREPSNLPPDEDDQAIDSFKFGSAKDDGETAYEYKLDGVMISSYDINGSADAGHDRWIDVLSNDWGTDKPDAGKVVEAGLRSDGELVQAVSEADMGGDFIL